MKGLSRRIAPAILILFTFASAARLAPAENWPHWRGPAANGVSHETGLAVTFGPDRNVAWKVRLPGRGMSTPIVWENRVFVTSQVGEGPVEMRSVGRDGVSPGDRDVSFAVQCFMSDIGELLWERRIDTAGDLHAVHPNHNLSTPSAITDGQRLFVWFATGQLLCLDLEGETLWERNIAEDYSPFELLWGHGSSPAIDERFVFLLCDHDPAAYLLAIDKVSGKTVWKADRGRGMRSYSTPYLMNSGGRRELLINSNPGLDAYDPGTGKHLWSLEGFCKVPIPMPVAADGIIYTNRGYSSGPYMAIRSGGEGNVTDTHVIWRVPTGAPYVSSLLYYRDLLFMATERGVVRCVDPKTGETLWQKRLGVNFSASPVGADGKIYLIDEDGNAPVVAASREFELLALNEMGEPTRASPAVSAGRIFIRTDFHLFAIGE